ncbi:hypothetical protein KY285_024134 [Solanum tuberosum]|nr:hypothetical protein KY285_024134 [Solanum tuberosum]
MEVDVIFSLPSRLHWPSNFAFTIWLNGNVLKLLQVGVLKVEQRDKVGEQANIRHVSEGVKSYRLVSQGRHKICQETKGSFEGKKRKNLKSLSH